MLAVIYVSAALALPQCQCPSGFAFSDNTVTRTFDVATQSYGGGCVAVDCPPSMCVNGVAAGCTVECKSQTACCASCDAGHYRNHSQHNGKPTATCEPLACPANSAANGQTECVCAATHYRGGWQPGTGSLTEANVRTMQLTSARDNQPVYDLEVCVEVQPTCLQVAHCKLGPTCAAGMPFTGTCVDANGAEQCDDGYQLSAGIACAVDGSSTICSTCEPIPCPNGSIYE